MKCKFHKTCQISVRRINSQNGFGDKCPECNVIGTGSSDSVDMTAEVINDSLTAEFEYSTETIRNYLEVI